MSLQFTSDGAASTTIRLVAMHNNNGTEKIIGFDNVTLTCNSGDGIGTVENEKMRKSENEKVYDLGGRPISKQKKGLYISNSKKHLR